MFLKIQKRIKPIIPLLITPVWHLPGQLYCIVFNLLINALA